MTGSFNRRALIAAVPAAVVAGTVPAAAAETETPVKRLFDAWMAAHADLEREDGDAPSPEWNAVHDRVVDIEERAALVAPETAADVLMKACMATGFGAFVWPRGYEVEFWAEARALVA